MLNKLQEIARKAGEAIMEIYDSDDFNVELKGDGSPLTRADKAAHLVIAEGLEKHFPEIPVLSEEGKDIPYHTRKNWQTFFLVDPLDGTKEFIKRNGEFTVNIALIEDGNPITGVVYAPVLDNMYAAEIDASGHWQKQVSSSKFQVSSNSEVKGSQTPGASSQQNPVSNSKFQVSSNSEAKENQVPVASSQQPEEQPETRNQKPYRIVASRSHNNELTEAFIEEKRKLHGDVELVPMGSSLKICLVAEGKADVYPRLGPTMEWDTAAAHAVALAAGCTVLEYKSNTPLTYNKENLLNPFFIVASGN